MSRPVERYSELLDQILLRFDLSHDFGRKRAYEAAIDHARENLVEDPHCDEFLKAAAKRLGFAPVSMESLKSRVKLSRGAWLDVWISDEDDEVALTGTRDGIQYLIDLLTHLKNSNEQDEHLHLDRAVLPMTESSANLVLFKEDESWFTGTSTDGEYETFPQREIEPNAIYAIQFIHFPPDGMPITANKLYRVLSAVPDNTESATMKEFPEGEEGRYLRFTFLADGGERLVYTFHLDDPGVNFFTHREILTLAMQVV